MSWEFRDVQWTIPRYAYMLMAPTMLYFACSLLVPHQLAGAEVGMEEHFLQIRRPLYMSFFFTTLVVMVDGDVLADEPLWHSGRLQNLAMLGLAIWGYVSTNKSAHKVIALMTMLMFIALIAIRFWNPR